MYNHPKVKTMVSFTHGEGFGRPLLEATMVGLPVIASGWSGQIDFLNPELSLMVDGAIGVVPKSQHWKDIIISESKWFNINENHAYSCLNDVYTNYELHKSNAEKLMIDNLKHFKHEDMTKVLNQILEKHIPKQVELKLPKLKKKTEKIELPNLSKVMKEKI